MTEKRWRFTLAVVNMVLWGWLLAWVAFIYSRAGFQAAWLMTAIIAVGYHLGSVRAMDRETAQLDAKLDNLLKKQKEKR